MDTSPLGRTCFTGQKSDMYSWEKSAGLAKRYTNHCIRATCVTLLDENFDPTHIMGVSMHKSLSSVLSYRGRVKK